MTQQEETKKIECVKLAGEYVPILEMWESYSGWYWFVTEHADPKDPDYCFGLVVGFEKEAGYFDLRELRSLEGKVWTVPKMNWSSNSHVEMIEESQIKRRRVKA
jgi:hypothetical protein